ncbi:MAG TPA: AraC family transcriptional regulator [Bacillota bacterium]|nr:AraC family transcriptional regulator [Bacillota bacterium]
MKIRFVGIGIPQHGGFISDRPNGSGDYDLLFVRSPAFFVLGDDRILTPPDTLILYGPSDRQYYGAVNDNYSDDFIHFVFEDDEYLLAKYNMPVGSLIGIKNAADISSLLRAVQDERTGASARGAAAVDLFMQLLFLKITENITQSALYDDESYPLLNKLRSEIYSCPGNAKNVTALAHSVGMSNSLFYEKYKRFFNTSPTQDIIEARIGLARLLLKTTSLTIKQIAADCGYTCLEHFLRQFKLKAGQTPAEYRKSESKKRE